MTVGPSESATTTRFVVGLGNPGPEYRNHRHNIGFQVVDLLTEALPIEQSLRPFSKGARRAEVAVAVLQGGEGVDGDDGRDLRVVLVKPLTYMNRSGVPTAAVLEKFGGNPEEVLVIYDELDLPLGRMRVRRGASGGSGGHGSSGGHRGIESLLDEIGGGFDRLRLGIGRPSREVASSTAAAEDTAAAKDSGGDAVIEHVLGDFADAEQAAVSWTRAQAVAATRSWWRRGVLATMNEFNGLRYTVDVQEAGEVQETVDLQEVDGPLNEAESGETESDSSEPQS